MNNHLPRFLIEYATDADANPIEQVHVEAADINDAEAKARSGLAAVREKHGSDQPIGHRIMTGLGAVVRAWRAEGD